MRFHVRQGVVIDSVVVMADAQQLEEVDSALAVRAFKPGKKVIAHVGAVAILGMFDHVGLPQIPRDNALADVLPGQGERQTAAGGLAQVNAALAIDFAPALGLALCLAGRGRRLRARAFRF